MNHCFLTSLTSFALFIFTLSASAETNLEKEMNLSEGATNSYSPYSYKANCSYLDDEGCSGSVYNPATGGTYYAGYRPTSNNDRDHHKYSKNNHRWGMFSLQNNLRNGTEGRFDRRRRDRHR